MNNRPLLSAAFRLVLAWALLSLVGLTMGRYLVDLMIPVFTVVTESASPDFSARIAWNDQKPDKLTLHATFVRPLDHINALPLKLGTPFESSTNLGHVMVPVVILFSVIAAFQVTGWRQRLVVVLLGLAVLPVVLCLVVPYHLAGQVEIIYQEFAARLRIERPEPFFLTWMLFTEAGGRWLIPIVTGILCMVAARKLTPSAKPDDKKAEAEDSTAAVRKNVDG